MNTHEQVNAAYKDVYAVVSMQSRNLDETLYLLKEGMIRRGFYTEIAVGRDRVNCCPSSLLYSSSNTAWLEVFNNDGTTVARIRHTEPEAVSGWRGLWRNGDLTRHFMPSKELENIATSLFGPSYLS